MKTRREFFKTLAGSMAVVAACVVAPKSLMAKKEVIQMGQDPNRILKEMTPISGHATDPWQTLIDPVEERLDNIDSWIQVSNKQDSNNMVGISQEKMWKETKRVYEGALNG